MTMPDPAFMICLLDGSRVPADEAGACPSCGGELVAESVVRAGLSEIRPPEGRGGDEVTAVDTRRAVCFCGRPFEGRRCAACGLTIVSEAPEESANLRDTAVRRAASDPQRRLGKFVLMEKIGEGGMGAVWKAWQTDLQRHVAIKFVKDDDPELLDRFIREARTAAGLSHPNIVATFEAGERKGRHYIAMDYIEGDDLKKRRVDVRGAPGMPGALEVIRDAADAVHYAHRKGIVHRDLKPANLMLDDEGRVRVMDFGLAKSEAAPGLSMTGTVIGTPYYMPPEQARGMPVDARSDVYSLGATLYELVTGHPPFQGKSLGEVLRMVLEEEPIPPRRLNPKLDRDVETIVQKAMEKEPSKRYPSAKELAEDLRRELAGEPIAARPLGRVGRAVKWSRRKPAPAALIGLAALALVGATAWLAVRAWRIADARQEARAALETGYWVKALGHAERGLQISPDDSDLTRLRDGALAAQQVAEARAALGERPGIEEDLAAAKKALAEADVPGHAAPAVKEQKLWPHEDDVAALEARLRGVVSRAEQAAHAALRFESGNPDARRLLAGIYFDDWRRAVEARDATEAARFRKLVEDYGGADLLAAASAPVRVSIAVRPADARAFLFRYEERGRRLVPQDPASVEPPALDAGDADKQRVRDGSAYPLDAGEPVTFPTDLRPGSYLVLLRREGFAETRYPLRVEADAPVDASVMMERSEDVPPGFVFVPAGPYIAGGDPKAEDYTGEGRAQRAGLRPDVGDFFIQRYSTTCAEYLQFLNDREEHDVKAAFRRSPRTAADSGQYWKKSGDRIESTWAADWPVFGISWHDAKAYAAWYTKKHPSTSLGVNWKFELPTEDQWEKAARGTDGRWFPWGNRFDEGFCAMLASRETQEGSQRQPEPYGLFPADESPYGVRDMAGCIRNWTLTESGAGAWRVVKGGAWGAPAAWCRSADRYDFVPANVYATIGVRLAAVRAPDDF